jgi:F420-0:gamma-glutamyl ligase-like protein
MSRGTELIIRYNEYDQRLEVFIYWLRCLMQKEYKATVSDFGPGRYVLSTAEDMFKVFADLYRMFEAMRQRLGVEVAAAVCSGDECIDMSEMYWPKIVLRDDRLERLTKVVHTVKGLITGEKLDGINVEDHGDFIRLSVKCCNIDLQIDEAVSVADWLLAKLYSFTWSSYYSTWSEVLLSMHDKIMMVFNPADILYMPDMDLRRVEEGVYALSMMWCGEVRLTTDEILRLVYRIMDIAVSRLKAWKEHEAMEMLKAEEKA